MNPVLAALQETAPRILDAAHAAPNFQAGWQILEESGLPDMLAPENPGWPGLVELCIISGARSLSFPAGAPAVTRALLAQLHIEERGFCSLGLGRGVLSDGRFSGVVQSIPWGRHANFIATECAGQVFALATTSGALRLGQNLAGEPRDMLEFRGAPIAAGPIQAELKSQGALVMASLSAGAMGKILALSIEHANTRIQFGKPLGKFQAVQQNLALLAGQAAAAAAAARAAALAPPGAASFERACAKLRAARAAESGVALAHQIHGAIGFTEAHPLHHHTRRLLAWSGELGNARYWAEHLGLLAAEWGPDGLWRELTARMDAAC